MAVPCPPWRCACRTHQQVPPCSCLSALCRSCEGVILTCVILTCMPTHMHAKADALLELRRRATSLTLQHRVFALALCCHGGMSTLPDVHARARTCDSISLAIESRKEQIECRSRQQEIERGQQAIPHAQPAVGDGSGEGTVGCGRAGGARLYSGVSCWCAVLQQGCVVWCVVCTKVCRVASRSPPGSWCILAERTFRVELKRMPPTRTHPTASDGGAVKSWNLCLLLRSARWKRGLRAGRHMRQGRAARHDSDTSIEHGKV